MMLKSRAPSTVMNQCIFSRTKLHSFVNSLRASRAGVARVAQATPIILGKKADDIGRLGDLRFGKD